jgi:hypothetical protein
MTPEEGRSCQGGDYRSGEAVVIASGTISKLGRKSDRSEVGLQRVSELREWTFLELHSLSDKVSAPRVISNSVCAEVAVGIKGPG